MVSKGEVKAMVRKIVVLLSILVLAVTAGCTSKVSSNVPATPAANLTMQRKALLASKWQMYQMQVDVDPAGDLPLAIKVNQGDKVDGYFYVISGDSVGFSITGNTTVYQSAPDGTGRITSDRFAFTSTTDQGNYYSLDFKNTSGQKVSVYLEMIFPSTGGVFKPVVIN